ncbi:acn9-domain-containing protein [Phaffia rhodozyma]|uniref:Succinate dehydrogenase assembly factor 3 n=1 Tax=Phaffia rhodozyma TaxID=264483 RepID=A0A0F7SP48_PHARH|nr:acn9-domain-containing protein [Phaffia rhodozyma]
MQRTLAVRYAATVIKAPRDVREASVALLPPIPLFRRLLRAHRKLPIDMRSLGDTYVRDEFKRHKSTDNPLHIIGFLSQWKHYLDSLEKGELDRGRTLDMEKLEKMSNEQMGQLYELMHAAKNIWKTPEENLEQSGLGDSESAEQDLEQAIEKDMIWKDGGKN